MIDPGIVNIICSGSDKRLMCWSTTPSWVSHWFSSFPCYFLVSSHSWMVAIGPLHYIQLSIHWSVTYSSMAAGPPGTNLMEKSFHCVLLLITCLGSGGLNWVTVGALTCWRGHGKCERQSPSIPLKDFIVTAVPFTFHYRHYTAGQEECVLSLGCFS